MRSDIFHYVVLIILSVTLSSMRPQNDSSLIYPEESCLKNIKQLTYSSMGFEKAGEAYFSPDGKTIIFQAVPKGQKYYQIYTMDLDTLEPKMVSVGVGACTCAYFRPDGKKIIFASSHESPDLSFKNEPDKKEGKYKWELTPYMNIYEANPDGTELRALTQGAPYHAECAYSPDGSHIVFASNLDGHMNLYSMESDGKNVVQITSTTNFYNGGPFYSPDGKKILFRSDRIKPDYLQIYVIDADGSNERQLTDNCAVNWAPYWHPNGKTIAFTTSLHGHHSYEIYLLNLETQRDYRVTYHLGFDGLPVFNQEGTKLLWTSKRGEDSSCQVFIADFMMPDVLK